MTCRHCQPLLSPYIDGVLSSQEQQEVLAHLARCLICAQRLRQLEENRQLIGALPALEVTAAMQAQLLARIRSPQSMVHSLRSTAYSRYSALLQWSRNFPLLSYGTVATCTASLLFYFAMIQAPPKVSAAEVVSTMDQLLSTLDANEGEETLREETRDEDDAVWQEDFNQGFVHEDDEPN